MRRVPLMLVLLTTLALASASATLSVDFAHWDRGRWLSVREERFPQIGEWVQHADYIENFITPGSSEKDIVAAKDGLGITSMLLKDFSAADLVARCSTAFEGKGAPAIIFRVQREGTVTGPMYSLVVYEKGLNLWKFNGKKWGKVGAAQFELGAGVFYDLMVDAHGGHFVVHLDGALKLECDDPEPLPAGEVGLWSGEGVCRFKDFAARGL